MKCECVRLRSDVWGHGVDVWRSVCTNAASRAGISILKFGSSCNSGWMVVGYWSKGRESGTIQDGKENVHHGA